MNKSFYRWSIWCSWFERMGISDRYLWLLLLRFLHSKLVKFCRLLDWPMETRPISNKLYLLTWHWQCSTTEKPNIQRQHLTIRQFHYVLFNDWHSTTFYFITTINFLFRTTISLRKHIFDWFLIISQVLIPRETGWFGFYGANTTDTIVPLEATPLWKEDWIGLRTLQEQGKLYRFATDCIHQDYHT